MRIIGPTTEMLDSGDVRLRMHLCDDDGVIAVLGGDVVGGEPRECLEAVRAAEHLRDRLLDGDVDVIDRLFDDEATRRRILPS